MGLCEFNGARHADEASYHYLKETRASLASLFVGVLHMAPEIAEHTSGSIAQSMADCLSNSLCVQAPHLASTCALSLLNSTSNPIVLMQWLEKVM